VQRVARRHQRLPLDRVLVGLVEQHRQLRGQPGRQPARGQVGDPSGGLLGLAPLALDRRERRGQRRGRRLPVPTLAALVEIHRCGVQRERRGGGLDRQRGMAEVFAGEIEESELVIAGDLPQEVRVEFGGELLCTGEQRGRRRLGKAQQHRRGLDFQALAGGGFDLERGIVVGEDRAGLAVAVVLEKDVHGMDRTGAATRAAGSVDYSVRGPRCRCGSLGLWRIGLWVTRVERERNPGNRANCRAHPGFASAQHRGKNT
jgi:hypothetical protein